MVVPLTFNEWLKQECCMNESQLTKEHLISVGYKEDGYTEDDIEDYIQGKQHDYSNYLSKFGCEIAIEGLKHDNPINQFN